MSKILQVKNVSDYSHYVGAADFHPWVNVIDFAEVSPVRHCLNSYGVYGIFLHDESEIDLAYGRGKYDYHKGALICVAPGQIGGKEDNGEEVYLTGWALLFHPDLLHGTHLEKKIKEYSFFDYRINEALHMTDEERDLFVSLIQQTRCQRFYNRQFMTRKLENSDILIKFDNLLRDYFAENLQVSIGLPTVQYFADKLCMSPNYFGDLIKKTTGDTASNYIRQYIVQQAKNMLVGGTNVSQAAYSLGFEYSQHLSRMFKKQTGMTPSEYCLSIQNQK